MLLDVPGGTYWAAGSVRADELVARRLISPEDLDLVQITDDVDEAVRGIEGFYSNYHSLRFVDRALVIRLRHLPSDEELDRLDGVRRDPHRWADRGRHAVGRRGRRRRPCGPGPDQAPVRPHHWAHLRRLIDALNNPGADAKSRPAPAVADAPDTVSGDATPNPPDVA